MLSGHTHGGQICLPGGIALMTNAACPRPFCKGAWRYHAMQGYTSVGSGSSVVGVRFNCLPEITLHHLRTPPGQ
jgi:predicted MPP superfamily phosphohydrolase